MTGGTEALHQLVHVANECFMGSAAICYWPFSDSHLVPNDFAHYDCPVITRREIPRSALVVLPEIWPEMSSVFSNRVALWWLSVDNFGATGQRDVSGIDLHLCQSHYAWLHTQSLGPRLMLTDWVDVAQVSTQRRGSVVLNPAKDSGLMAEYVSRSPDEVVLLRGMNRLQVAEALRSSSLYIEFGHHPGRDRIPREAAIAGCGILSTRLGSARHMEDMPLPDWAFFHSTEECLAKASKILQKDINIDLELRDYRSWVSGARHRFEREVRNLLSLVG